MSLIFPYTYTEMKIIDVESSSFGICGYGIYLNIIIFMYCYLLRNVLRAVAVIVKKPMGANETLLLSYTNSRIIIIVANYARLSNY